MSAACSRTALARAEFFLSLAESCTSEQRNEFEAYIDASIIFARTALQRIKTKHQKHPSWKAWFEQLGSDSSVCFFRESRDFLLKERPLKIGQIISFYPVKKLPSCIFLNRHKCRLQRH